MALLDLSGVTRVLVRLLEVEIGRSPAWDGSVPNVSPLPPDKLGDAGNLLGMYLYHVGEDPAFRNQVPPGSGASPVALTAMGLVLHYQLTAHTNVGADDPDGAYQAQLLFGLAMKALHDVANISDRTRVGAADVQLLAAFGLQDRENAFRVVLRPVPVEEAVHYWTAGQGPARLAAYYELSVVLLEPVRPPSSAVPVVETGVTVFVSGTPRLEGSESRLAIKPPGETEPTIVVARPAQVAVGGRFTLVGSDLVGESTTLVVHQPGWDVPEVVDALRWEVTAQPTDVTATVRSTAGGQEVVPGVYSVGVQVVRIANPQTDPRPITQTSNLTAMVVVPTLDAPGPATVGTLFQLTGGPFVHPLVPSDPDDERAVRLSVGGRHLTPVSGTVGPGQFEIVDEQILSAQLPADLAVGFHPVRVRVNGAESGPRWLEVVA